VLDRFAGGELIVIGAHGGGFTSDCFSKASWYVGFRGISDEN